MSNYKYKKRTCPYCGNTYHKYPDISLIDNRTEICPDCGILLALLLGGIDPNDVKKTQIEFKNDVDQKH